MTHNISRRALAPVCNTRSVLETGVNAQRQRLGVVNRVQTLAADAADMQNDVAGADMKTPVSRRALAPVCYASAALITGANAHRLICGEAAEVLETIRGLI
ncbi:hypothetical protein [Thalassoglobus polymorphus]|uniref:Uncharacterized protein n=1 Tax=Thalassoglobus polymorphus TaxID=2527994 RepID=A0A517QT54_9PLAN|nr:hypothetical protein [Thalassoglobus polymorphus]QDT34821.1 hypothetical protein Mal48_40930 [Thalassoglobus polymorphus]